MWVPLEETDPVLLHAPTRKAVALVGAVNLRPGQLGTQGCPTFDAVTCGTCLRVLLRQRSPTRRLILMLDNARYHHAILLQPFLTAKPGVLSGACLPPYRPELNPIERVWKLARTLGTHNHYFPLLTDLVASGSAQLDLWRKPNPILVRLCGII